MLHHTLSCHHEPRLHRVEQVALITVVSAMTPVAIVPCAGVTEPAQHIWMYVNALVPVAALWEELALFARVQILTLSVRLVTLWPVFAAHEYLLSFLIFFSLAG